MKNMVRFGLLLVVVLMMGVLSVSAQDDVFRVAVVAPSATNDLAFSQSMYDALLRVQAEMGEDAFQFDFQEGTFVVDDAAVALRDWAASGEYDLIIAHGSQYGSIIEELAPEFPEVSFAWGTDVNTFGLDNVYAYTAAAAEGGYVNGAVAATLSESGIIGVVGPIEVGDAKAYVDGFVNGALATDPEATVNVTYIGSFSDVPLATEAANAHVQNGADVLTGSAQMVVGAIGVAQENELLWFGTQSSQADLAAEAGVSFQVYHWEVVLNDIIANLEEGVLGGEAYTLTLENGGLTVDISESTGLDEETVTAISAQIDELITGIIAGDIVVLPPEPEATPAS
ncbi:MAG: BMP family protein [Chloroflexi bacterium]|uniref:BMP family lipoprotein n=1 Tax=Candidatus Flexifilum breve TaxID=3140694 RepID=UPI003134B981|nr:BMP family protein [Chloroflexota bacterium]